MPEAWLQNIEAETAWPQCRRRNLQVHFLECEKFRILNNMSLKYVPRGLIDNIAALVQMMAWRRTGDKPLSEAMSYTLLTHIYASPGLRELTFIVAVVSQNNRSECNHTFVP